VRELLLGVDVGTASTKGVLARADGTVVASAQRDHEVAQPHPGWVEQDAERIWWQEFADVSRELLAQADGQPAAVCTSGLGPCLFPVDERFAPLRPAILYGVDTRASSEIALLNEQFGAAEIFARSGSVLSSQAVGPKLAWLRRHEPDVWERRRFLMAHSFLVARLCGAYVLDHQSASQCDPLYDRRTGSWAQDWAKLIAPGLQLPQLVWPAEVVGEVTAEAERETGIPAARRSRRGRSMPGRRLRAWECDGRVT